MKRIRFNADVVEVEAPEMGASSSSRLLDSTADVPSIPPLPPRPKKTRGTTNVASPLRASSDSSALNTSVARDSPPGTSLPGKKSKSAAAASSSHRVVTGFRGAVLPEYKGHMPRVGHTAFVYQRNFYIFGGINAKGQYSSYLFCHEKRSLQWEEVRSVGLIPSGRANVSAIQYDNKFVIYGGNRQLDALDDMYSYDLDANRWEKVGYEKSQGPGPVFLHTAVHVAPIETMMVLGGFHQREHNMYVGHAFDLRNRIWTGLPGPRAINPQHLQLVSASYYDPKQSIVVIGLVERNIRELQTMPAPSVYLMNVHSWVWTKVSTVASPESPIPFHMDVVWDYFTRQMITMGGFYEELQQTWFFPLSLEPLEQGVLTRGSMSVSRNSSTTTGIAGGGFVDETRRKSRPPRYGFFKLSLQDMMWSIVPINLPKRFGNPASATARTSLTGAALRTAATAARRTTKDATATTTAATAPRVQKAVLGDLNLDGVGERPGSGGVGAVGARAGSAGGAGQRSLAGLSPAELAATTQTAGDAPSAEAVQQQAVLFTVHGEPQFQRKYAYAAYRDPQTTGKRKPMQYLIMHGGLQTDASPYSLVMFTPSMTRTDALSGQRAAASPGERAGGDLDDSASFSNFLPDASRSFETEYSTPFDDVDPVQALAEREQRLNEERQDCLLPVLPCARTTANAGRFAMLYHSSNSMQTNRALPYTNTPAAVLERPEDVMQWSTAFYRDKRRWLAEKLKVAVTEDRRLRRGTRRQPGAARHRGEDPDGLDGDEDGDEGSRPNSGNGRQRPVTPSATRGSTASVASAFERNASHLMDGESEGGHGRGTAGGAEADAIDTAVGVSNLHADDFFKAKGLEPFVVEKAVLGTAGDPRASDSGEVENPFLADSGGTPEVIPAGLERLWMKVKRHGEQQRLPAAVFRSTGTVNDGTMTGDLGSAMAFLLLRNAIAMLPADDTPEKRSHRALLRWHFLRALVCTGEAAFIIYRANQRDARTKGQLVTGYPGLVMAPELLLVGASRAHKVPTRPVPYTVSRPPAKKAQYAEVTKSGMVAYHNIRHVK